MGGRRREKWEFPHRCWTQHPPGPADTWSWTRSSGCHLTLMLASRLECHMATSPGMEGWDGGNGTCPLPHRQPVLAGGKEYGMGKGNGEEKQKGVKRDGRCSPVSRPWLSPAQTLPFSQALGHCVLPQHQTHLAQRVRSPWILSYHITTTSNIRVWRQQKRQDERRCPHSRGDSQAGQGGCSRGDSSTTSPSATHSTRCGERQEGFSSDHHPMMGTRVVLTKPTE